jgi:membrane protein
VGKAIPRMGVEDATERQATGETDGSPDSPTDLGKRSYWRIAKRTVKQFRAHNLTDWAAALTYYSVLSIFPGLIVLVSILGLVGQSATQPLVENVSTLTGGPAKDIFVGAINDIEENQGAAGVLFVIGFGAALWSASGYVGAFMNASNVIYGVGEGRPFWKKRPIQLAVTLALVLMTAALAVALVLTGPLARTVGDVVGVGDTAVTVWSIAKWPVMLFVVITMFAFLYWVAPNVKQPRFRWLTPGGALALFAWIVASAGFAFYVANFGSYSKTYGALGGVVVFLVWIWITNLAILFGAEFDAELERQRELEEGLPAQKDIQLPPRDEPKPA